MTVYDKIKAIISLGNILVPGAVIFSLCLTSVAIIIDAKRQANRQQLKKSFRTKAHGIVFGKQGFMVVQSPGGEGHVIVTGGSGMGKTTALLIPTLRAWTGTSFTVDIAGDICQNVGNIKNKMVYKPAEPDSVPYNVFGAIDALDNEDDKNEALEALAFLLMPDKEKMADAARFFNTEGRKILTASLIAFYHAGLDFIPICERIVGNSWKQLFHEIDLIGYDKAIQYINSFEGASETNTSGCKQEVDGCLKLFATNERVKRTIRRPYAQEIAFTPSVLEKNNVFVVIDDSKLALYSPLLHLITAQSLEYFSDRPNYSDPNILFCLDELPSLGKLDILPALRKFRKKHVRVMVLTQSMADLDLIYGRDERMAMMNNFSFKVILSAGDSDTQEYFAKLIGYKESEVREYIVKPAELARLENKLVLLYPAGYMILEKNFYYKR